jgi:FMN phosphatase YigB (HAD superfamily)
MLFDGLKLIIFDLDNTIFDYDFANNKAIEQIIFYISHKYNLDETLLKKIYYDSKSIINNRFKEQALGHDKTLQIKEFIHYLNNNNFINDNVIKLTFEINNIYKTTFLNNAFIFPNILTFLNICKNTNIKLVILTNNILNMQLEILNKLQLFSYFDDIFTSYEIGYEKPDSRTFKYIFDKYNYSYNEILMIGDNYSHDYQGAINFGFNSILFDKNINIEEKINNLIRS